MTLDVVEAEWDDTDVPTMQEEGGATLFLA